MRNLNLVKETFLWWMGLVYFCAFTSLYFQMPGLYGDRGILPAKLALKYATEKKDLIQVMNEKPTLLGAAPLLGIGISRMMEILCLGGMAMSLYVLCSRRAANSATFFILWIFYLSVYQVGQTFLWFQWDILLLEAGLLTILVSPLQMPFCGRRSFETRFFSPHDNVTLWLVRWLLFRLMFASGVVKLTSQCPTWWGLTALNYHYESQCIPTPLAWTMHHFPDLFQKFSVIITYVIEIPIPFLFFSPVRALRIFSYWSQVLLQIMIILTGNYNFFNLLTLVLAISLVDDDFLSCKSASHPIKEDVPVPKKKFSCHVFNILYRWIRLLATIFLIWSSIIALLKLVSVGFQKDGNFYAKIRFSSKQFLWALNKSVPISIWIGILSLSSEIIYSLFKSIRVDGFFQKLKSIVVTSFVSCIVIYMFCISLVPHTIVDNASHHSVWPVIRQWYHHTSKYQAAHSYGLFRRMTGVGGRPEIVIEGSNSVNSGWKEYEFLYKPGNVSQSPKFVAPHQPRLDWQMWFAALGSYHENPWFVNLISRLFDNEPDVLKLIGKNPFPNLPPKYIKATLYTYKYTPFSIHKRRSNDWWTRSNPQEYIPLLTKDNPALMEYLKQAGLKTNTSPDIETNVNILMLLGIIRGIVTSISAQLFLWTVCTIAVAARYLSNC